MTEPRASQTPQDAAAEAASGNVEGAGYNPFASVGTVAAPAPSLPPAPGGDWGLPLAAALIGAAFIAALLRRLGS